MYIPGYEISGVVVRLGPDVPADCGIAPEDEVVCMQCIPFSHLLYTQSTIRVIPLIALSL